MIVNMAMTHDGKVACIVCDVCGGIISDIKLGAVVFPSEGKVGTLLSSATVHKGKCHDAAENDFGGNINTGWFELVSVLDRLAGRNV